MIFRRGTDDFYFPELETPKPGDCFLGLGDPIDLRRTPPAAHNSLKLAIPQQFTRKNPHLDVMDPDWPFIWLDTGNHYTITVLEC